MRNLKLFSGAAVLAICFAVSCKSESAEAGAGEQAVDSAKSTVADSTKFKFDLAVVNVPPPAENIQRLERLGIAYNNNLLNPTQNLGHYQDEFKKSVNMGIYNIDMAYAMINNNSQDALNYIKTTFKLSEGLGLQHTLEEAIGKRAETNAGNKDSLIRIFNDLYDRSDDYLRTNQRLHVATLIFAGSWVESLYLNCKLSAEAAENSGKTEARRILWEQRFHLENLIRVLNDFKAESETAELINKLSPILEKIKAIKSADQITDASFGEISSQIESMRTFLIN